MSDVGGERTDENISAAVAAGMDHNTLFGATRGPTASLPNGAPRERGRRNLFVETGPLLTKRSILGE